MLGLEVVGVSNGRDAVERALATYQAGDPFDLVLMDLEMPIVDGYEATRRIRDGGFSGPILARAQYGYDYRLDSIKMGCNDCICKPIDWIQLADLIRRFIPGCNAPGPIRSPTIPRFRADYAGNPRSRRLSADPVRPVWLIPRAGISSRRRGGVTAVGAGVGHFRSPRDQGRMEW